MNNHYLVTTKNAADLGVPAVELGKLASRGSHERLGDLEESFNVAFAPAFVMHATGKPSSNEPSNYRHLRKTVGLGCSFMLIT